MKLYRKQDYLMIIFLIFSLSFQKVESISNFHNNLLSNTKTNLQYNKKSFNKENTGNINEISNKNIVSSVYNSDANPHCLIKSNSNSGNCFICEMGYLLNEDFKCKCNKSRGCLKCNNDINACEVCNLGFELDADNNCKCEASFNSKCETCSINKQVCSQCFSGYYYNYFRCLPSEEEGCSKFIEVYEKEVKGKMIKLTDPYYKCVNCNKGLSLNDDSCVCIEKVNNCNVCSKDNRKCIKCDEGFVNYRKGCLCSLYKGCSKCDEINNECLEYENDN